MKYSIDTSAVIRQGDLRASEEVLRELEKRDDDVYAWARDQEGFIVPLDDAVQDAVSEILGEYQKLNSRRVQGFRDSLIQTPGCDSA